MFNEALQDYYREDEEHVINEIQPEGWDENGVWIGMKEWEKKYGKKIPKRFRECNDKR